MKSNLDKIAKDLYGKIETRFTDIKIGDENAETLSRKEDIPKARFFEFEYMEDGESLGTIAITLDAEDGIVVQVSGDLVDDDEETTHHGAYRFIRSFRKFARNRLINFDVQNIGKSNLDKRDYMFQAKRKEEPVMAQAPIMENKMYGTMRISYQDLGESRLVVKHSQPVNTDLAAGRTMHIEGIYIENAQGERFRYPYKSLAGARALAEHINHNGTPYDSIGKHIIRLSEELSGLRKFKGYVSRQSQVSEAMGTVTDRVLERIEEIKKQLHGLQRPAYYESFVESFEEQTEDMIPEEVQNDLINRLTIRTFNEEMKAVFPYIYKFVDESVPATGISPDDLLDEESEEKKSYTVHCSQCGGDFKRDHKEGYSHCKDHSSAKKESFDPEMAFEAFMEDIVREDKDEIFSPNKDAKIRAIGKLNQVIAQELPGGPGGINAIESLKGLIDDPEFIDMVKDLDPNLDVRPVLQQWLHDHPEKFSGNAAETMALIDFAGEEAPEAPAPEMAPPAPAPEAPAPEMAPTELPPEAAPTELPPEAGGAPAPAMAPQPAPVAESSGMSKLKAHFIKARVAGATLETVIDFGNRAMTLGEAIEECGMEPAEVGYDDEEEYQEMEPAESGIPAMLKFISGFYNKDADAPLNEGNFTIGGTRMKIKVKKAWEDGEFGDCPQEDVIKIFKFIDSKDPSHGTADFEGAGHDRNEEQSHILRLAGVAKPEMEVAEQLPSNPGTGPSWDVSNIENAMKNIKLKFGDEEIDMAHPDPAQLQRIGGGMMQKGIQQVPNQNVQFPGGQMNPQDMMKAIMQKINFGN